MKLIEDMRERPEEERLAFAAIFAGIVALILFLVWGAVFFSNDATVAQVEADTQSAAAFNNLEKIQADFSAAVDDLSFQYEQVQNAIEGVKSEIDGQNTVDVHVDENGDVRVDNIIVTEEELTTQE